MTTWNYIIGNEKDFEGAPEWAMFIVHSANFNNTYAVASVDPKTVQHVYNVSRHGGPREEWFDGMGNLETFFSGKVKIIAQREPVESPKWVYYLGTPEMFARMSEGVTHLFRSKLTGVITGVGIRESGECFKDTMKELIGHRGLVTDAAPVAINDSKYNRPCKGITIDVYDVLKAFDVTCPALQHLVKKALAVGQRGHKDASEDLKDILASAKRAIELSEGK